MPAAVQALQAGGLAEVGWRCDDRFAPETVPTPCHAFAAVGGRQIFVFVTARPDRATSLRNKKVTFSGVEVSLQANLAPPP